MEPVLAWQDGDFVSEFHVIHADAAFGFAITAEHFFVDLFLGKGFYGGGGRGTRGRGTGLAFHELRDDAVESLFTVHDITMDGVGGVENGGEELVEARKAGGGMGSAG